MNPQKLISAFCLSALLSVPLTAAGVRPHTPKAPAPPSVPAAPKVTMVPPPAPPAPEAPPAPPSPMNATAETAQTPPPPPEPPAPPAPAKPQTPPAPPEAPRPPAPPTTLEYKDNAEVEIFHLTYADPHNVAKVLAIFGYPVDANDGLRVVAARAPRAILDSMRTAIVKLDVPGSAISQLELECCLLGQGGAGVQSSLPEGLSEILDKMTRPGSREKVSFHVLASWTAKCQDGTAFFCETEIPGTTQVSGGYLEISTRNISAEEREGKAYYKLEGLHLRLSPNGKGAALFPAKELKDVGVIQKEGEWCVITTGEYMDSTGKSDMVVLALRTKRVSSQK